MSTANALHSTPLPLQGLIKDVAAVAADGAENVFLYVVEANGAVNASAAHRTSSQSCTLSNKASV